MGKLIKCKSCGDEISKNAKSCPHCGEPTPKKTSFLTWLVLILFLIVLFKSMSPDKNHYSSTSSTNTKVTTTPTKAEIEKKEKEAKRIKKEALEELNYFKQNKEVIIEDINLNIKDKQYSDALKKTTKYLSLKGKDENITRIHTKVLALVAKEKKEKEAKHKQEILKKLKSIPTSEYAINKQLYQQLLSYEPNNKKYKEKVNFYTEKIKKEEENKRLAQLGLRWNYQESKDKMGRGTIKQAYVYSENKLSFDFPYQGLQRATLQLRKHPKYGKDVILRIEQGQFLCSSYNGCRVYVRFDNAKPITYNATEPSDHDSTVIFIRNYNSFVSRAKKSEKVYIEAEFYREGTRVMEFSTEGLKF